MFKEEIKENSILNDIEGTSYQNLETQLKQFSVLNTTELGLWPTRKNRAFKEYIKTPNWFFEKSKNLRHLQRNSSRRKEIRLHISDTEWREGNNGKYTSLKTIKENPEHPIVSSPVYWSDIRKEPQARTIFEKKNEKQSTHCR